VKVEIGIGRGKRQYDKRQDVAKRETDREIARALKQNR
jgi:SsrA-binding protein